VVGFLGPNGAGKTTTVIFWGTLWAALLLALSLWWGTATSAKKNA